MFMENEFTNLTLLDEYNRNFTFLMPIYGMHNDDIVDYEVKSNFNHFINNLTK